MTRTLKVTIRGKLTCATEGDLVGIAIRGGEQIVTLTVAEAELLRDYLNWTLLRMKSAAKEEQ